MTDVRKNGDLRWLRPDCETQVTIEYVPYVMDEIGEVVRLIPQERVQQRTVEPGTDHPDSSEDGGGSTSAVLWLSGGRACCDAATSANVTRRARPIVQREGDRSAMSGVRQMMAVSMLVRSM